MLADDVFLPALARLRSEVDVLVQNLNDLEGEYGRTLHGRDIAPDDKDGLEQLGAFAIFAYSKMRPATFPPNDFNGQIVGIGRDAVTIEQNLRAQQRQIVKDNRQADEQAAVDRADQAKKDAELAELRGKLERLGVKVEA